MATRLSKAVREELERALVRAQSKKHRAMEEEKAIKALLRRGVSAKKKKAKERGFAAMPPKRLREVAASGAKKRWGKTKNKDIQAKKRPYRGHFAECTPEQLREYQKRATESRMSEDKKTEF